MGGTISQTGKHKKKLRKRNIFLSYTLSTYTVEFMVLNACTLGRSRQGRHLCEKEDYLKVRTINN